MLFRPAWISSCSLNYDIFCKALFHASCVAITPMTEDDTAVFAITCDPIIISLKTKVVPQVSSYFIIIIVIRNDNKLMYIII